MQMIGERRTAIARIGIVLVVMLMVGFLAPKHADAATYSDRYMASLINGARRAHGRAPLKFNDSLSKFARRHSSTMASADRLYHNPYLAQWLRNWSWRILGENVGVGDSVPSLHVAFMNSRHHRDNILDRRFSSIGVGVVVRNGRTWVTVIFRG